MQAYFFKLFPATCHGASSLLLAEALSILQLCFGPLTQPTRADHHAAPLVSLRGYRTRSSNERFNAHS